MLKKGAAPFAPLQIPKDRSETYTEATGQQLDVAQAWLLLSGFHQRNVGLLDARLFSQRDLAQAFFFPQLPEPFSKAITNIPRHVFRIRLNMFLGYSL